MSERSERTLGRGAVGRLMDIGGSIAVLIGLLLAWQGAVVAGWAPEALFSQPRLVAEELVSLVRARETWSNVGITLTELTLGLTAGAAVGIAAGLFMHKWFLLYRAISPLILALYSIPRLALVPLFIVWFGFGMGPQITVALIHAFVVFSFGMYAAMGRVDRSQVASLKLMAARPWHVVRYVYLPTAARFLVAAFRQSLALGIASVIVAEMIGPRGGIGYLMSQRLGRFDVTGALALILLAATIAVFLDAIAELVERRATAWN